MKAIKAKGSIKQLLDLQTFASGFSKREFVVEVEADKYPQSIKFECVKDNTKHLEALQVGDTVEVTFDIRGNEFKDKFYVNLVAWKVEKIAGGQQASAADSPSSLDDQFDDDAGEEEDIPF